MIFCTLDEKIVCAVACTVEAEQKFYIQKISFINNCDSGWLIAMMAVVRSLRSNFIIMTDMNCIICTVTDAYVGTGESVTLCVCGSICACVCVHVCVCVCVRAFVLGVGMDCCVLASIVIIIFL